MYWSVLCCVPSCVLILLLYVVRFIKCVLFFFTFYKSCVFNWVLVLFLFCLYGVPVVCIIKSEFYFTKSLIFFQVNHKLKISYLIHHTYWILRSKMIKTERCYKNRTVPTLVYTIIHDFRIHCFRIQGVYCFRFKDIVQG